MTKFKGYTHEPMLLGEKAGKQESSIHYLMEVIYIYIYIKNNLVTTGRDELWSSNIRMGVNNSSANREDKKSGFLHEQHTDSFA